MKTIFELNQYYIRRTLTSTRLVMPLVVTVVFCGIFYNENGINPYSSFAATIMLSFAIMGWSVHSMQKQEALEEQILLQQSVFLFAVRFFFHLPHPPYTLYVLSDQRGSLYTVSHPCGYAVRIFQPACQCRPVRWDDDFAAAPAYCFQPEAGAAPCLYAHHSSHDVFRTAAGYAAARNICLCISSGFRYQYPKCKMDTGAHEGNRHIHIADAALCCCLCNRAGTNTYETKIRIKPCFITRYFQS